MNTTTRILHEGEDRETHFGALNPPIYHASTFTRPTMQAFLEGMAEGSQAYIYSRDSNPTVRALEKKMALLEGAEDAIAAASGMAVITGALLTFLNAGDHVLVVDACYGPTRRFMNMVMARFGVEVTYYHPDLRDLEPLFRPNTRLLYLESPGSHSFHIQDLPALAAQAQRRGILTLADNTWVTPLYQQPHRCGVDIVAHTGTKYINGHADAVVGLLTARRELIQQMRPVFRLMGATLGPAEAYLTLRGLRTLPLRMAQHQAAGLALARWLQAHPKVRRVLHPGLPDFPGHDLARAQMSGWGGLFAFELLPPATPADRHHFLDALQVISMGVSWGGFESLIIPLLARDEATAAQHRRVGLTDDCYRLSAGLEAVEDLIADLEHALDQYSVVSIQ
ncbi:MAG: cystathionine beta-lyase [Caldilineales bacterium]|nr:cystathionine beta-lyase [Caldilineales bacterium]